MILFLKHIFRAIRRAPIQPLLICLTVMLAVTLSITTVSLSDMFVANAQKKASVNAELGDILIAPRANSSSRLLFDTDAQAILGEDASVLGSFQLTSFLGSDQDKQLLHVSALDLLAADEFYRFSFLEYGHFTTQNLHTAAIISHSVAQQQSLKIGDSFTLRLLERDFTYTVQGIADDTGILAQSDVLISIDGLRQALSEHIPAVASLGESFFPYTRLMIKATDGADAQELFNRLSEHPQFADKNVSLTAKQVLFDYLAMLQIVFAWICLLILTLLCGFLIGSSLTLLHKRRGKEYLMFANAGASPRQISALLLGESMLYALLGCIPGLVLAFPTVRAAGRIYDSQAVPPSVAWQGVAFGLLFAPLLMLICTLFYLSKQKKETRSPARSPDEPSRYRALLVPLACTSIALLALLLLPTGYSYLAASVLVLFFTWLLFAITPPLLKCLGAGLEKLLAHRKRPLACVVLACKSLKNRAAIRYVGRLIAVFTALSIALLACERLMSEQATLMTEELPFEILATDVTPPLRQSIAEDPAVAGSMELLYLPGAELPQGATAVAFSISGDVDQCMPAAYTPQKNPTGNELALSVGLAERIGVAIGDEITVRIEGITEVFVISELLAINENFFCFDATHIGFMRDMLCIRLADANDQAAREHLINLIETNASGTTDPKYALGTIPETLSSHLKIMRAALGAALLAGLVAILNIGIAQHRDRDKERELLRCCGISRPTAFFALLTEILLTCAISVLLGALCGGAITLCMDRGMRSFGMVLFL